MRGSTLLAAALLAAATVSANAADTPPPGIGFNYTFPDGIKGFALQGALPSTGGGPVINPIVLVGFNPQPDPPGTPPTLLLLGDKTTPLLDSFAPERNYQFILSFVNLFPPGPCHTAFGMPSADGVTSLHCSADFGDGSVDIAATLQFFGPGGVASWVAFNPQPDPPGDVAAYDVGFGGDAGVALTVTVNGVPLSFSLTSVPEPGTLAVLGGGLIALAARRRSNG